MSDSHTSDLENLVCEIQKSGLDWIDAKLRSDQLEADEKNFLAALMNDLDKAFQRDSAKMSEAKLERLARGSKDFRDYIVGRVLAQAETGRKKVRYESLQSLWDARRSQLAFEREQLSKGIFHTGR